MTPSTLASASGKRVDVALAQRDAAGADAGVDLVEHGLADVHAGDVVAGSASALVSTPVPQPRSSTALFGAMRWCSNPMNSVVRKCVRSLVELVVRS